MVVEEEEEGAGRWRAEEEGSEGLVLVDIKEDTTLTRESAEVMGELAELFNACNCCSRVFNVLFTCSSVMTTWGAVSDLTTVDDDGDGGEDNDGDGDGDDDDDDDDGDGNGNGNGDDDDHDDDDDDDDGDGDGDGEHAHLK